ncbi:SDR family oxidoreductase [Rhodococcus sp. BP-252]|uniref:SDR family NAD(P)-dependent oxidoreductase n=1 Tax=unclassified Rhodococcus (in: high G+C Gram-positive bacteria) TaxID=192944 RepID=UPI0014314D25|nr:MULTISPECIES: SDR family NAD(P)-dependent oxidoreductase [unclassified Rhodococcus (in: high G+C Gram-positive bacteria)]NIL78013.1 2-(R)-hydroxypropyl-CoM dehydrogenase [Rhodococcus sp. B10]MBY6411575.1 SDR family oxidoreductase [Rhodococcus sp. BP-320]MBY6417957.1 SDR family oxidoreductase [Rhodococcus sp. BP-321]MBY6422142.1 SDR family oxidoreductase [Rhodococcus sp. BP-324]MBY6427755.1 SDR family oxidoreductase [Rhodococcus sp. BP-323]
MTSAASRDSRPLVAVVTGAASGIGRATTEILLERGGSVVAFDTTPEAMEWLAGIDRAVPFVGDVTHPADNRAAVAEAERAFGRLDALVLNAGVPASGSIETLDMDVFDRSIDVNLRAVVLGVRESIPAFRRAGGGSIVITASATALGGEPNRWPYAAAKAGVVNLAKSFAIDLANDGIRVNAVCPGPIGTGMTERIAVGTPERYEALKAMVPLHRWGTAREVGEVIAFLASPLASFVTGAAIPVDGGATCGSGQTVPLPAPASVG